MLGTGKTRVLACILAEYFHRGGRRCLWVTADHNQFGYITKECCFVLPRGRFATFLKLDHIGAGYREKLDRFQILRVSYLDLTCSGNVGKVEKWLGDQDYYDGLVRHTSCIHMCEIMISSYICSF